MTCLPLTNSRFSLDSDCTHHSKQYFMRNQCFVSKVSLLKWPPKGAQKKVKMVYLSVFSTHTPSPHWGPTISLGCWLKTLPKCPSKGPMSFVILSNFEFWPLTPQHTHWWPSICLVCWLKTLPKWPPKGPWVLWFCATLNFWILIPRHIHWGLSACVLVVDLNSFHSPEQSDNSLKQNLEESFHSS